MNEEEKIGGLFWATLAMLALSAALFALRMTILWQDVNGATALFRSGDSVWCIVYNVAGVVVLIGALLTALILGIRRRKTMSSLDATSVTEEEDDFEQYDALFSEKEYMDSEKEYMDKEETSKEEIPSDVQTASTWEGTLSAFSYFLCGFFFLLFAAALFDDSNWDGLSVSFCLISALCGVYFLLTGISSRMMKPAVAAFSGLIPAVWATFRMVIEYRDVAKFVNRPLYTANLLFLISTICFFIYQAQILLGDEKYAMPYSWCAAALLVVLFGLSARLPQLIGFLSDKVGPMGLREIAGILLDLALTLFAFMKVKRLLQ